MSAPQLKRTNSTPLMSLEAYAARSSASEGRKGLERTSSFGSSQPSASTSARANHTDLENPFCQNSGRKIRQANQATASTSRATGNTSLRTNSKGKAPMVQGSLLQAPLPSLLSRLSAVGNDPTAAMKQESKAEKRRMSQWQLLRYVGAPFYVPKKLMGREEEFQGISRADETTLRSIADKIREKKENDTPSFFGKEEKAMLQRYAQGDLLCIPNKTFEQWLEKNGFT
ncbi:hypothetical protein BKA70DRAFT_1245753 [Coprinopsis sp. MPI-PUGE-AT-0042]|nr:hypothetical protein BKA70DRAFT_1245753 [Coprinopsis sp. MPI-PUGE-AT-0042]